MRSMNTHRTSLIARPVPNYLGALIGLICLVGVTAPQVRAQMLRGGVSVTQGTQQCPDAQSLSDAWRQHTAADDAAGQQYHQQILENASLPAPEREASDQAATVAYKNRLEANDQALRQAQARAQATCAVESPGGANNPYAPAQGNGGNDQFGSQGSYKQPSNDIFGSQGIVGRLIGGIFNRIWRRSQQQQSTDCWHGDTYFVNGKPHPCTGYPAENGLPGRPNWPTPGSRPSPQTQNPYSQAAGRCLNQLGKALANTFCQPAQAQSASDFQQAPTVSNSPDDNNFLQPGNYNVFEKTLQGQERLSQWNDVNIKRDSTGIYTLNIKSKHMTSKITFFRSTAPQKEYINDGTGRSYRWTDPTYFYRYQESGWWQQLSIKRSKKPVGAAPGNYYSVLYVDLFGNKVEEVWGQPTSTANSSQPFSQSNYRYTRMRR